MITQSQTIPNLQAVPPETTEQLPRGAEILVEALVQQGAIASRTTSFVTSRVLSTWPRAMPAPRDA
jgi:hypothetical protein